MAPRRTALPRLPVVGTAQAEQPTVVDKLGEEDTASVVASLEGMPSAVETALAEQPIVVAVEEGIVEVPPPSEGRMAAAAVDKPLDFHRLGSIEGFEAGTAPQAEGAVLWHRPG